MRVLDNLIGSLREVCSSFEDKRRGRNCQYSMADIGLAAFSVFFMQSPSFLAHQRALEGRRKRSNCTSLFGMEKIPTDNHIRDMLDPVAPVALYGMFARTLEALETGGGLGDFQRLDGRILVALDGTEYHRSLKISCPHCSRRKRSDGGEEFYHQMLCGVLVAPGHNRALPLAPEFITPQDGAEKQDCESRAVRRWLAGHGPGLARLKPVYLGDDLYSRQPICEAVQALEADFLFVAKPSSHSTLMDWLSGIELPGCERRVKKGRRFETHRFRWLEGVPIRGGKDALPVNWLEMEIVNADGKITYRNSWVTSLSLDRDTVAEIAASRPREVEDRERKLQRPQNQGLQPWAQLRTRQEQPGRPPGNHEPARLRDPYPLRPHLQCMAEGAQAHRNAQALLSGSRRHNRIPHLPKLGRTHPNPHRRTTTT